MSNGNINKRVGDILLFYVAEINNAVLRHYRRRGRHHDNLILLLFRFFSSHFTHNTWKCFENRKCALKANPKGTITKKEANV